MPPPPISPDQILDYAPRNKARIVEVDANVAAYFGDLFKEMREGLKGAAAGAPVKKTGGSLSSVRTAPSGTAAARNRS
jgi:hypothetical protein